ncbi:MAG: galactose-1-phosphate uridylyltransferase [Nitrososphaerales archaeon]
MAELRKDYVLDRFVIVPKNASEKNLSNGKCPYCPGNEEMTSPAVLALVQKDGMLQRLSDSEENYVEDWCVRVFPSNDPAVTTSQERIYGDKPLYSEPAYGYHYVVVAAPDHNQKLANISVEQWANVLVVLQDRVRWLYTQKSVTYVSIYMDYGKNAGSSLDHPHLDIVTFATIPPLIEQEAEATYRYINERGLCPMCDVVSVESSGPRQILATDSFLALCPWAPTYPHEFWICPKRHITLFSKITQKEINDLALILRATLGGLSKALKDASFNLVFHLSPEKKNSRQLHWHIEVYPQMASWSGLERGFGIYLNNIGPESSAEVLGAAARRELAGLVGIT